jgi:hypothetical protein
VVEVREGSEYAFSLPFFIQPAVFRAPGEENLILQIRSGADASLRFGLQLWDDGGAHRGLWASGDAVGGERFLAPVAEAVWHEASLLFSASADGDGFYVLLLDGQPADARAWVSLVDAESGSAELEAGLVRNGERLVEGPDAFFGPTRLGGTLESVIP